LGYFGPVYRHSLDQKNTYQYNPSYNPPGLKDHEPGGERNIVTKIRITGFMEKPKFNGFPKQMLRFFSQLAQNNCRDWFLSHKHEYEKYVVIPSCAFIIAMGIKLKKISRKIKAIPRINKSLFRIHRDMRFVKNKEPYKNSLRILFWEGTRKKRLENPGFYIHIEKKTLFIGAGCHYFSTDLLKKYRDKLSQVSACRDLHKVLDRLQENNHIQIHGKQLKKFPSGCTIHNENRSLITYKGLHAQYKSRIPDTFYTPEFIDFCFEKYSHMAPLHKWITKL
jgi:uncharacterized protein (TIGR02453 family)